MELSIILSIAFFMGLVILITSFGYYRYVRPSRLVAQLHAETTAAQPRVLGVQGKKQGTVVKVIREIGEKVPLSPKDAGETRKMLMAAGFRASHTVTVFNGARVLTAGIGLIAGFMVRASVSLAPATANLLPILCGILGFMIPKFVLGFLVKARQEKLRLSLPDALDLLVICVEAGTGLDQAIQRVSDELAITHKEIAQEFSLVTLESRAGKRRVEALQNLGERTGSPDVQKLVQVLAQTDRFGTSVADALRAHSDYMRVKRRQDAQERAGQVGVKLIFPIFFFILPSIIAVSCGPAMLQVFKVLMPMLQSI
jgi:tight adherence protein C